MKRVRRAFTAEFKQEAVRQITELGRPVSQVARELDLRREQLRTWRKQLTESGAAAPRRETTDLHGTAGWNWYDAGGLRALSKNGYSNTNYPVPDTTLAGEYTAYVYDGGQPVLLLQ